MYQRHRCSLLSRGPSEAQSAADPAGLRMVRRTSHEHDAGNRRPAHACRGRRYLRRVHGHRPLRYEELDGFLHQSAKAPFRGNLPISPQRRAIHTDGISAASTTSPSPTSSNPRTSASSRSSPTSSTSSASANPKPPPSTSTSTNPNAPRPASRPSTPRTRTWNST